MTLRSSLAGPDLRSTRNDGRVGDPGDAIEQVMRLELDHSATVRVAPVPVRSRGRRLDNDVRDERERTDPSVLHPVTGLAPFRLVARAEPDVDRFGKAGEPRQPAHCACIRRPGDAFCALDVVFDDCDEVGVRMPLQPPTPPCDPLRRRRYG